MSRALRLVRCADYAKWDAFVEASPQGTVFCRTAFLAALGVAFDLWWVEQDGGTQMGAVMLRHGDRPIVAPHEFTCYQGILFAPTASPPHRRVKEGLELTTFLLEALTQRYDLVSFCLHHSVTDVRAFQWFRYHTPEEGRFRIDVAYTGLLDLQPCRDFDAYLRTLRLLRRREATKARAAGCRVRESSDVDLLCDLHRRTFERQGIVRPAEHGRLVRAMTLAALTERFGELLVCEDRAGQPLCATLFLYDRRTAYYLFGGNDSQSRPLGASTLLMLENIRRAAARNHLAVDFVGINSPNRGDFKTSFNAVPTPYFVPTWRRVHAEEPRAVALEPANAADARPGSDAA